MLFEANKKLNMGHYPHTTNDINQSRAMNNVFYDLYFGNKIKY